MLRKGLFASFVALAVHAATLPGVVLAEENDPTRGPKFAAEAPVAPKRLANTGGFEPAFILDAAGESKVEPITSWNLAGNLPLRNGIERPLPKAQLVVLPQKFRNTKLESFGGGLLAYSEEDASVIWVFSVKVQESWRLRMRLGDVHLPKNAQMWVYGENEEFVGPFGTELIDPSGTLWTPSVEGPEIRLEVSIPEEAWTTDDLPSLRVEAISEIFPLGNLGEPLLFAESGSKDDSCMIDAACAGAGDFPEIVAAEKAVAHLQFQIGGSSYICTGTLMNDKDEDSWVPYLLTANHCISSQGVASTLEAFFDYMKSSCGGYAPSLSRLPRSTGSTLLETSSTSDFTLVRLNQLPAGRWFMGWTTAEPTSGQTLYRVSHPHGLPAAFSTSTKISYPSGTCGQSSSDFHFTDPRIGSTFGGSSGSALLDSEGHIVGQLKGICGPNVNDQCDYRNNQVDGKFKTTFSRISRYINEERGGGNDCVQNLDGGTVCLRNGRFELKGTWTDFSNPPVTKPLIWSPVENINATAGFQSNPSGIQVVMRVADGCSLTGTWWIWVGGFSDAGWDVTVRDTVTGNQRTYTRSPDSGVFPATFRDTTRFTCD